MKLELQKTILLIVKSEVVMKILAVVMFGLLSVANAKEVIAPGTQIIINKQLSFRPGGYNSQARFTNGVPVQSQRLSGYDAFVGCDVIVFPSAFAEKAKDTVFTVQPTEIKSQKGHILRLQGMLGKKQTIDMAILCQREMSGDLSTASYDLDLISTHLKDMISVKRLIVEDEGRPQTRRQSLKSENLIDFTSIHESARYKAYWGQAIEKGQIVDLFIVDGSLVGDNFASVCTKGTESIFVQMLVRQGRQHIYSTFYRLAEDGQFQPCADTKCPLGRVQFGDVCG